MVSRSHIPETINSQKLLKDISKEIRQAERYLISLNPPKPERESKRKKKKPLNKDFVDYEVADRMKNRPFTATLKETSKADCVINETLAVNRPSIKMTLPKPPVFPYEKTNTSAATEAPEKKRVSKTGKQSPKVIRFKLGDKEVVRSTNDNIIYGNFAIDSSVETSKELTWKQTSVYDFHDGSNESDYGGLTVDEAPKRRKATKSIPQKKVKRMYANNIEILNNIPKNGIEELLKASVYTLGTAGQRLDITYVSMLFYNIFMCSFFIARKVKIFFSCDNYYFSPSASSPQFEQPTPVPIG